MEKGKLIIYWIFTALAGIGMFSSGLQQIFRTKQMLDIIVPLGFPLYFMTMLGIWKIIGVITIVIPGFKLAKEWAYAGLFFIMSGALISHLAVGDFAVKAILGPLFQTIFILLSWYFRPASRKVGWVN